MSNSSLISLEEANGLQQLEFPIYPRPNGITCPDCKQELVDVDGTCLCSDPPKTAIKCLNKECMFTGYRTYRYTTTTHTGGSPVETPETIDESYNSGLTRPKIPLVTGVDSPFEKTALSSQAQSANPQS